MTGVYLLGQQGKLRSPKLIKFKAREKIGVGGVGGGGVNEGEWTGKVGMKQGGTCGSGRSTSINKF